jgi:two-component system, OmpR family, heavy metal sensor histidine kinase CusS
VKRLSIRWRLTLWYGIVLSAILAGFSAAVYALMHHHLLALTDAALEEELTDLAGDVTRCPSPGALPEELGLRYASHDGYESEVSRPGGAVLFRSDGLGPGGLPGLDPKSQVGPAGQVTRSVDRLGHARLAWRTVAGPSGPLVVQVAVSLAPNDRALEQLLIALLLAGPPVIAGTLGGGYLLARKALAPVDRMAATVQEITSTRLDRRVIAPNSRDELGRLANTFNDMIARLQRSFEEIRRFTADAAHELRTPLASMRTEAEVALRAPRSPERDQRVLEDLLEEIDRLTRLVAQLLFLCREDAGLPTHTFLPVRLDEIVRDVANHMQVMAREKELTLEIAVITPCVVHGEPDRLRQLYFNLLDNAIKYTPPGGIIKVSGESTDGHARIAVTDSGIGIPAAHLPRVFDRFYRIDPSRSREVDGTGLGLAICRSIAEVHGGRIRVTSDAGKGCEFAVELPIDSFTSICAVSRSGSPRSQALAGTS